MQASTYMQAEVLNPTRQRLLDAAFQVCSERGLHAATTREIADVAHVNEVTLFRHFGNKEKLIAALFERSVAAQVESFSKSEPDGNDLAGDLGRYAQRMNQILFDHDALIRTMISEARRYPEQARQVICEAVKPMRDRLGEYLRAAQRNGLVRRDLELPPMIDAFTGMLLAGMLRRTGLLKVLEYSQDEYVTTVVELFLRGIAPAPISPAKKRRSA
ncbi:MAG: TetR/AcrR family transcriptional regulator [Chthoniobacter sp.]|uniref:TetR/AcrR family transcriptional regulator n=1 Tax=Chthoniobacter sp. TaxID=2510640 RepID=UPI0032A52909